MTEPASTPERGIWAWCRTAKPTEWMTAFAAIGGGILVWSSGIIDAKRTEIATQIVKLETRQSDLDRKYEEGKKQLADTEAKLSASLDELAKSKKELASANAVLEALERSRLDLVDRAKKLAEKKKIRDERVAAFAAFSKKDRKTPDLRMEIGDLDEAAIVLCSSRGTSQQQSVRSNVKPKRIIPTKEDLDDLAGIMLAYKMPWFLRLYDVEVNEPFVQDLAKMDLIGIEFTNSGLTDRLVRQLPASHFATLHLAEEAITILPPTLDRDRLRSLKVQFTSIGNDEVRKYLASNKLAVAQLSGTPVSDDALRSLSHRLEHLHIDGTQVMAQGIAGLLESKHCPQNLYISHSPESELKIHKHWEANGKPSILYFVASRGKLEAIYHPKKPGRLFEDVD